MLRIKRDSQIDAAQLAAWRALWRILLTPRPQPDGKVQHPAE